MKIMLNNGKKHPYIAIVFLLSNNFILGTTYSLVMDTKKEIAVFIGPKFPRCLIYEGKEKVAEVIEKRKKQHLFQTGKKTVLQYFELCQSYARGTGQSIGFIYPGTNWCGPGNIARYYDDLGSLSAADSCCRKHDDCQAILAPGECIENLCNNSSFTRYHCKCEMDFRKCLRKVNTDVAITLSVLFYNNPDTQCFKKECFPQIGCNWIFKELPWISFGPNKKHQASLFEKYYSALGCGPYNWYLNDIDVYKPSC